MIELTTEQHEIQEWAREFAARYVAPRALELDKNPESPVRDELIREAAQAGLMGNNLPEFLGGQGHDPLTGALVTEELAAACSGITVLLGATMLGIAPILASGDLEAINRFVKPLADSWESDQPRMAAISPEWLRSLRRSRAWARISFRDIPRDEPARASNERQTVT
ncbi:MAG: acyl-CoA dehydrogenase family protein [Deltaproteobacteria bacterium]|nr:acyl-CoA dehydrogenase family protein [Deltaproteobacteria bacterium]